MHPLIDKLVAQGPVVTDGAWGTELQARGLEIGCCPDAWNVTHPAQITAVARAYVEAGAQIILSNTFGGNRFRLGPASNRVGEINAAGVRLARQAAGDDALVFASIGPSGLRHGEVGEEDLLQGFAEQVEALMTAEPDGFVVETIMDIAEARLAIRAAEATGLPIVASMAFDATEHTLAGDTLEDAVASLTGADVIGANCGQGIAGFVPLCRRLKAAAGERPVWIKPNAGLPILHDGRAVYAMSPEDFARFGPALVEAGASFIGGCCGAGPAFIAALKRALKGQMKRNSL